MYYYRWQTGTWKQKQKEMERKLIKSVLRAIHDRQALVGPGASQCLLAPYFDNHLGWKYNLYLCNLYL